MNMDLLSNRLDIEDLMVDYCAAIDRKQFDELDEIFTEDAWIDYTCFGGPKGNYPEIKEFLQKSLPGFPHYYHMISNIRIRFGPGDKRAKARTICHNPMVIPLPEGGEQTTFFGLWYVDELVQTAAGWRLSKRVEEPCYIHNLPKHMASLGKQEP